MNKELLIWHLLAPWEAGKCFLYRAGARDGGGEHRLRPCPTPRGTSSRKNALWLCWVCPRTPSPAQREELALSHPSSSTYGLETHGCSPDSQPVPLPAARGRRMDGRGARRRRFAAHLGFLPLKPNALTSKWVTGRAGVGTAPGRDEEGELVPRFAG